MTDQVSSNLSVVVAELARKLRDFYGAIKVECTELWSLQHGVGYVENAVFIAHYHFDVTADLLIFDPAVGSIGLVRILTAKTKPNMAGQQVRSYVDQAAYLRHLLVNEAERQSKLVPSVELVLVYPASVDAIADKVAEGLRDTITSTDLLDGIGVNTLGYQSQKNKVEFEAEGLGHAFAWLLHDTREWLQTRKEDPSATSQAVMTKLAIDNFRTFGTRELELPKYCSGKQKRPRIHLVHGQNGSGKSSIAEAIEFAVTGRLRRLGDSQLYAQTLCNRDTQNAKDAQASVTLFRGSADKVVRKIEKAPIKPLLKRFDGRALVLDQATMDDLSRAGDARRAATLLGAFFPEDYEIFQDYEGAEKKAKAARSVLSAELENIFTAFDVTTLSLAEDTNLFSQWPVSRLWSEDFAAFLPLKAKTLEALAPQLGDLQSNLLSWLKAPPDKAEMLAAMDQVDAALEALRQRAAFRQEKLSTADKALKQLAHWEPNDVNQSTSETYTERLNRWLRLHALTDLADRRWAVARTLEQAKPAETNILEPGSPLNSDQLATLNRQRIQWRTERDQARSELQKHHAIEGSATSRASEGKSTRLREDEIAALNEAGEWLEVGGLRLSGLGDAIGKALKENCAVTVGAISIGAMDWKERLAAAIKACLEALGELKALGEHWLGGRQRHERLLKALRSHHELMEWEAKATKQLTAQLQKHDSLLGKTLTEFAYLLTPARWAYEKLNLKLSTNDNGQHVLTMTGDAPEIASAHRLNAAELYSVALAMFLLCARRPDNTLRLLVLDDPFLNMDELTVSTVARAIGRLVRLWPDSDGWRLLILLHRESDVRCFAREVPCTIHRLPWLSPKPQDSGQKIETEFSRHSGQLLDIDALLKPKGSAAGTTTANKKTTAAVRSTP